MVHTARRYTSPSNSYLIVRVNQDVVQVGKPLIIEMVATRIEDISTLNVLVRFSQFYSNYMPKHLSSYDALV